MQADFDAFLDTSIVRITQEGANAMIWYQSGQAARRAFCGTCGARFLKEVTAARRWLISACLIDQPTGKQIIKNLLEPSKPDWCDLPAVCQLALFEKGILQ